MTASTPAQVAGLLAKLGKDFERMRVLLVDRHSSARNSLRVILSTLGLTSIHHAASSTNSMSSFRITNSKMGGMGNSCSKSSARRT